MRVSLQICTRQWLALGGSLPPEFHYAAPRSRRRGAWEPAGVRAVQSRQASAPTPPAPPARPPSLLHPSARESSGRRVVYSRLLQLHWNPEKPKLAFKLLDPRPLATFLKDLIFGWGEGYLSHTFLKLSSFNFARTRISSKMPWIAGLGIERKGGKETTRGLVHKIFGSSYYPSLRINTWGWGISPVGKTGILSLALVLCVYCPTNMLRSWSLSNGTGMKEPWWGSQHEEDSHFTLLFTLRFHL